MKHRGYTKGLVLGIIIIFVGASFTSNISGNSEKIELSSNNNEDYLAFPLNEDDYINAFWKFDEGSGNILEDSSVHDYDGAIYGATWTTGQSSYALDFDGVNDYVDLDAHSEGLGFNKTDDLIFSFYFKSSSTNRGIIYSSCRGDAYGYNPGFHIALASNGTIEIQVWRQMCGLLTWSDNSYNDGSWHYVKVYYNGISSNPQVYIYVDGTLDKCYKKYVCSFYSDNFKYAQIGRNSDEYIDYFDGILDEFKIIKYAGGNEQNPPIIDGPKYGDVNIEYEFTFTNNDPEEDDVSIQIEWGDGHISEWTDTISSGEAYTASHEWDEEKAYCIKARSKDFWHESVWSDCYEVKIGNQPPGPPTIDGTKCGYPGIEYDYTFVVEDPEEDDVQYFINWGDGDTVWTDFYTSGEEVTLSHSWISSGDYNIESQAKDNQGSEGEWSVYPVRFGNHPPNTPDIDGPSRGGPGVEITYVFTATDLDGDNVYYEIDWDDGNVEEYGPYGSGEEAEIGHIWEEKETYIIRARAKDELCGSYSSWAEYKVSIPRNRVLSCNFLEWLFEQFPLLERMLLILYNK